MSKIAGIDQLTGRVRRPDIGVDRLMGRDVEQ